MSSSSIAVVGAGIAGLAFARRMQAAGRDVVVFDKGRAAGGRAATRRRDPWRFDHGAQFFTARDERFAAVVEAGVQSGRLAVWPGPFATLADGVRGDDPRPGAVRYVGVPGMSALPRLLAEDLQVETQQRVAAMARRDGSWWLTAEDLATNTDREHGPFAHVVLALPAPQAAQLLADESPDGVAHAAVRRCIDALHPCLCTMVAFDAAIEAAAGGLFVTDDTLSWIAHDGGKPGREDQPTYVLHGTAAWSKAHFDDDRETVATAMLDAFGRILGVSLPPVRHSQSHRWGFALAEAPTQDGFAHDPRRDLSFIGDAMRGGRVEGAFESGMLLADAMLGR